MQLDFCMQESLSEAERQQLAADAHRVARAAGLEQLAAASMSGGITLDSLTQSNPLAVKVPHLFMAIILLYCSKSHEVERGLWRLSMHGRLPFAVAIELLIAAVLQCDSLENLDTHEWP